MIQRPVVVGLMLCEQVIVEEKTHNITLVNCLTRLRVRAVPLECHRLAVYAWLSDGLGDGKLRLELARLDTLDEIWSKEIAASFFHPLQEFRAIYRGALSFPVVGSYQISLLADGAVIAQRRFEVVVL